MASKHYPWQHGRVHYDKRGMGDPLLLVHNVYPGASHEEYERNISELARHFTVYAIDLLGFGDSDAPRMKYDSKLYVRLIGDFIRDEIGQPAQVISSGLSCAYVSQAAASQPDLFSKLVFICPRSEPVGLDIPRWFAPIRHFFLSTPPFGSGAVESMAGDYEIKSFLLNCFHHPKHVTPERIDRLRAQARKPGHIYPCASLMTGYLDLSILESLPRLSLPVLLIWGRKARPSPVEHSVRLVALAKHCRLEIVEDAGAWVHDEQSAAVNRIVTDFLEKP